MGFGCCVPLCSSRGSGVRYFRVPFTNAKKMPVWLAACPFLKRYKITQLENVRFCIKHFSPESIKAINGQQKLTVDAVPTLNLPCDKTGPETTEQELPTTETPIQPTQPTKSQQYLEVTPIQPKEPTKSQYLEITPMLPTPPMKSKYLTLTPIQPAKDIEIKVTCSPIDDNVTIVNENPASPVTTVGSVVEVENDEIDVSLADADSLDIDMDVDECEEMWDVRACRGCLAVKGKLEKISDGCKRLYTALTGLEIAEADGYPHYFCLECRTMLKKCLAFRRKTRRAHFVMKEIMSVRKQVTYSDIITVNRKKTNLDSSLGYWEPQKTCALIMKEDEDPQPDIEPTGPFNMRVVDIKPENDNTKTERPPTPIDNIDETVDMDNNDINDTDFNLKDELFDIDLNDVFKDLNDDDHNDDAIASPEPEIKNDDNDTVKQEPADTMSKKVNKFAVQTIASALEKCTIKVMSLEQQKKRMEIRKCRAPFLNALYKCAMCLTVHRDMNDLVEHVKYHNNRRYDHECAVCRNKYLTAEDLNIHVARCHMYEYKCKCGIKRFSLHDIVKHWMGCDKARAGPAASPAESPLKCFTKLALTQDMMHHVRALRRPDTEETASAAPEVITADDFKCDVCGEWLKLKKNLESHMTIKHRYLYTCKICNEVFTERRPALIHGKTHRKEKTWPCEDCDGTFKNLKALVMHGRKRHQTKNTCNLCGQLVTGTKAYYRHQLTEHKYLSLNDPLLGDPQFKCGDCEIQFIDRRSLETHLVSTNHTGASEVEFACVPCKKIFENNEQLETHYITCKNPNKYPRKCCYCSEMLLDKNLYLSHYVTQHPMLQYVYTNRNAICDICGKLIRRPQLEAHLKMHSGSSYVCGVCGVGHAVPAAHVAHVLCYHTARPYRCALCPRRFQHKGDCRDHILKVHAPAKLYKCEFCVQEFSYFRNLREHSEKLHNLVIPSVKSKCKKSKSKIFVYAHMKIEIHEQEREAVEKADIALLDYLDQKSKPIDYKDVFIFSKDCEQIFRKQKRLKAKELKIPKIEIESDIVIKPGESDVKDTKVKHEDKKEHKMKIEMITSDENEVENAVRNIGGDENEMQVEDVKEETQEMVIDEESPLEVFENDGNQFVMIGDELYRLACDDEVE